MTTSIICKIAAPNTMQQTQIKGSNGKAKGGKNNQKSINIIQFKEEENINNSVQVDRSRITQRLGQRTIKNSPQQRGYES